MILPPNPHCSLDEMERAWQQRDAGYDGAFVFAVKTTGIYCRPSCPSRPKREHIEFFSSAGQALAAGYRACKRCRPDLAQGEPPAWIAPLMARVTAEPDRAIKADELRSLGITPERARRWFQMNYGMTFSAWCRALRLSRAFSELRHGSPLDEVVLGHGFDSHSGFREAFARVFQRPPGASRDAECVRVALIETPLGTMLAAASHGAVCHVEFADRRELAATYTELVRRFSQPVVHGDDELLERLREEIGAYFSGTLQVFSTPIAMHGTSFQQRVWSALRRLPFGKTASYEEIAREIGQPSAVRAVARANATNRLSLLVPCHRVIASTGELSGYGGGVWRKRHLLELERSACH